MMTASSNTARSIANPLSYEQTGCPVAESNVSMAQPSLNTPHGPVAILWDIENCPVPSDVRPEDVAGNIRMALRIHPVIEGAITLFSAYGDFNAFPRRVREGCQRTGVKLVDVPNGRKDAADKAILIDMFLFALDNRPPSSIMLISGDVDFAPALHILGQRGYTVILVIPSGVGVSSALCNAGRFVWDWQSVARGEGFVPSKRPLMPPRGGAGEEEEAIVYRGLSQSFHNARDSGNSLALPCSSTDIQPGDVNALKVQLVKLLELSGGCLPLVRVPTDYQKLYGRTFYISDYGALKLVNLLNKMSDVITVAGKGQKKHVRLKNGNADIKTPLRGSSEELSDEEKLILEERNGKAEPKTDSCIGLEQFKYELQEILVSYSCRIFISCFEEIYRQRYKRLLDYHKLGASSLEELLSKVGDVAVLREEPGSKLKFVAAVGS